MFLDFRRNPVRERLDPSALSAEARDYLDRAGVLFGTPVERLRRMNDPAYRFYLERNPYLDLERDLLEVDVCAQHNNGGLVVDAWWQSNVAGLFPVGEAAGAHGVYRPGGAALNSGQVGAMRAAQFIAARRAGGAVVGDAGVGGADRAGVLDDGAFAAASSSTLAAAQALTEAATARAAAGRPTTPATCCARCSAS